MLWGIYKLENIPYHIEQLSPSSEQANTSSEQPPPRGKKKKENMIERELYSWLEILVL